MVVPSERLLLGGTAFPVRLSIEQGVLATEPGLTAQLRAIFEQQVSGTRAWQVTLANGKLRWSDGTRTYDSSPKASAGQKFQAWLAKVLPLDSQL